MTGVSVCVCVCACVCMRTYVLACLPACVPVCLPASMYVCRYVRQSVYLSICRYADCQNVKTIRKQIALSIKNVVSPFLHSTVQHMFVCLLFSPLCGGGDVIIIHVGNNVTVSPM